MNPTKSKLRYQKKSIPQSDTQNEILIDLLVYTQISIDIYYDSINISCQQRCHADWVFTACLWDYPTQTNNGVHIVLILYKNLQWTKKFTDIATRQK